MREVLERRSRGGRSVGRCREGKEVYLGRLGC